MSNKFNVCPTCSVSWYVDEPPKHMMTCTDASRDRRTERTDFNNALNRLTSHIKEDGHCLFGTTHQWDFGGDTCAKCGFTYEWATDEWEIDRTVIDDIKGKKMNSLERLKEAAEHPGSYINGPDIALALKVIEASLLLQDEHGLWQHSSWDALFKALAALTEDKP